MHRHVFPTKTLVGVRRLGVRQIDMMIKKQIEVEIITEAVETPTTTYELTKYLQRAALLLLILSVRYHQTDERFIYMLSPWQDF